MFGRKCSLCGGKLDSRNVCKECGLDNAKSDKYYKINQSNCDNMPLTHVHEDNWQEKKASEKKKSVRKTKEQPKYFYQSKTSFQQKNYSQPKKKNAAGKGKIGVLVGILVAVLGLISSMVGIFENVADTSYESVDVSYDPYEYLEEEHPAEGDSLSYTLTSGEYVVGVHIAPGDYYADVIEDYDSVEVTDHANSIYLYEYPAKEEMDYLDDLRLFEGAIVSITSGEGIQLHTDNAQTGATSSMAENFVTESYKLVTSYEAEAGVDFEPGIYDISTTGNYAYVYLTVFEDGVEWDFRGYDLGTDGIHGPCVSNVVIPEGAVIMCEQSYVSLVPSEMIWTTDYMEHYY